MSGVQRQSEQASHFGLRKKKSAKLYVQTYNNSLPIHNELNQTSFHNQFKKHTCQNPQRTTVEQQHSLQSSIRNHIMMHMKLVRIFQVQLKEELKKDGSATATEPWNLQADDVASKTC